MLNHGHSWSGHERHCAFLNLGETSERFATVSAISGLDWEDDGRAVSVLDWDHDGDLDLWFGNRSAPRVRLMRNDHGRAQGGFLKLKLVGDGQGTNRDAIGARVELVVKGDGPRKRIRTVRAGEGFLSQNSKWVLFGLGADEVEIERVIVKWPGDGPPTEEVHTDLLPDRHYIITQGQGLRGWEPPASAVSSFPAGALERDEQGSRVRLRPITQFLTPNVNYITLEGAKVRATLRDRWTWLNFWGSWCMPCHDELREIGERANDLRAAGVQVLALAVDPAVDDGQASPEAIAALLEELGYPFDAGTATKSLLRPF